VPTSPLDSAYGTGRKTPSCCLVEPDTNTPDEAGVVFQTAKTCRTAKKREQKEDASSIRTTPQQRTKEQKQLTYGTSKHSDSEQKSTPTRTPMKKATPSLIIRSRSSPMKAKTKMKWRPKSWASPKKRRHLRRNEVLRRSKQCRAPLRPSISPW